MNVPLTTRREFLRYSLAGAGLTVALFITPSGSRLSSAAEGKKNEPSLHPQLWVRVTPENEVIIVINKSEMGQGVSTSLPMIVADELEAAWKQVRFVESPAGPEYVDPETGMQLTGGSTSVRHMYDPLRKVGATARQMLLSAAARTWKVPPRECEAVQGTVKHAKSGQSLNYGQLAEAASNLSVPKNVPMKKESQFRYIGKPMDRLDVPDKVKGAAMFGIDTVVPGMLYGAIARPPTFGAKVTGYEKEAVEALPGVVKIAQLDHGVAVIAESLPVAWKARKELKAKWDAGSHPDLSNESLEKTFLQDLQKNGVTALDRGDTQKGLGSGVKKIESTYLLPYLAHVTMEPMDCTAHVKEDQCEIWVPTQNQSQVLQVAAKATGLKPDQIKVHTTYLGGGFGRRGDVGYAEEAVQASKAVARPVKIIWTREEDIQNDVYRPGYSCRIAGGVDGKGKIVAWSHKVVVQSIFERFAPQRMKGGVDPAAVEGIVDMDYEIPNLHVEYVKADNPIPIGFWRSVGNSQNGFTTESFMDELAHAANKDPLEFRLNHLKKHLPATRLLQIVAEKAGWGKPPRTGQAFGVALHLAYGTRVAQIAEVSADERSGVVSVHRVVAAVDCGPVVVNPAIITAQMKGAILMGLSAALKEKVLFEKGGPISANFYNYHQLRMSEAPEIEVYILKNQKTRGGIGEPGLPPIAPAVANALFSATGKRVRRLPLTPAEVKQTPKEKPS